MHSSLTLNPLILEYVLVTKIRLVLDDLKVKMNEFLYQKICFLKTIFS